MDRLFHISMFFTKSDPGFDVRQNPWISLKIYPPQTILFAQIWPDIGFPWIRGITFKCFSQNLIQDLTLTKIYGIHKKSAFLRPCLLTRSGQIGFLWIGGIIFQCFSQNLLRDLTLNEIHGFHQKSSLPRPCLLNRSG